MLQCDAEKASTFDTFFAEAEGLLAKKVVHVFHVNSSQLHEVLIDPSGRYDRDILSLQFPCKMCSWQTAIRQILLVSYVLPIRGNLLFPDWITQSSKDKE